VNVPCPEWSASATPAEEVSISAGVARVYESTLRTSRSSVVDHGTLKTWHRMLFSNAVPLSYYAGNFRGINPKRPCLEGDAHVAGVFGTPVHLVEAAMSEFSANLRAYAFQLENHLMLESRPHFKVIAKIGFVAWAMAKFIQIHPFRNGNGRIARLLANHLCYRYELPMPFRFPSQRPTQEEYEKAGHAAMMGDPLPTFQYLLGASTSRVAHIKT